MYICKLHRGLALAATVTLASLTTAHATVTINYSTGAYSRNYLGNGGNGGNAGADCNRFRLHPVSNTLTLQEGVPEIALLNTAEWDVAATDPGAVVEMFGPYEAMRGINVNGNDAVVRQTYTGIARVVFDSVYLGNGPTATVDLGDEGMLDITPVALSLTANDHTSGNVTARFVLRNGPDTTTPSIPEPGTMALLSTGAIPAIGLLRRRR